MRGKERPHIAVVLACTAILTAGCGSARTQQKSGTSLGQPVATVATSPAAVAGAKVAQASESPEAIHSPPPPAPRPPTARAILAVVAEFARGYLRYQIGEHPKAVEQTIRSTSTPSFARFLLAEPATVPFGDRANPAYRPAALTSVVYSGAAALGPGQPTQIVIAAYRVIGNPSVRGQLTIHVTRTDGGWRVASLG